MAKLTIPEDKDLAARVLETHSVVEQKRADHGLFGLLGDVKNKPSNIAFIVIGLCFLFMGLLLFAPIDAKVSKDSLLSASWTVIMSALGFLFGRASRT